MTTIAYRDGVMASDSASWGNNSVHPWCEKVVRGADGTLYGGCGDAACVHGFFDWVRAGCVGDMPKPTRIGDDQNTFTILIASPSGIEMLSAGGRERYLGPYVAVGAADGVAYGALFMGATAEQAIEAALLHGNGAAGAVQAVRFDGVSPRMLEMVAALPTRIIARENDKAHRADRQW